MRTGEHLTAERRELVGLLETLSPQQWETPSLCAGWRVRDVVAHLLYDAIPLHRYAISQVRYRFDVNRLNNGLVDAERTTSPDELLKRYRAIERGTLSRYVPMVAIADLVVHQQDIRRPLSMPRTIDPERLRVVLDHPDPFAFTWRNTRGLRFVATDLDWAHGSGPEVRGTGEALALAAAGRPIVLDELEGDGVKTLRTRIAST